MHPVIIATILGVLILFYMVMQNKKQLYYKQGVLVIVALLISGVRELIRFDIMTKAWFTIYMIIP